MWYPPTGAWPLMLYWSQAKFIQPSASKAFISSAESCDTHIHIHTAREWEDRENVNELEVDKMTFYRRQQRIVKEM